MLNVKISRNTHATQTTNIWYTVGRTQILHIKEGKNFYRTWQNSGLCQKISENYLTIETLVDFGNFIGHGVPANTFLLQK